MSLCGVEEGCRTVIGLRQRVMVVPMRYDTWQSGITKEKNKWKTLQLAFGPLCMQTIIVASSVSLLKLLSYHHHHHQQIVYDVCGCFNSIQIGQ